MATVVLGAQWGDEGKGKLVDILCSQVKICARAQGGHNAGHTIVANGISYDFHLLPSGLLNPKCLNLIGSGVVVHVPTFFSELAALEKKGLENVHDRIFISDRCQIDFDLHTAVDGLEEVELGSKSIGTTRRGIGPTYSTKAARTGVRLSEVFDQDKFENKLRSLAAGYKKRYGDLLQYEVEDEIARFKDYRERLRKYCVDAAPFMADMQKKNIKMLVEGANALMLDLDWGTYPYVTSSNTGLGGIFTGLALNPTKISSIVGVVKAYTTRVGGGPLPTEDTGEVGTNLQEFGKEWGVSTGRRRRCGWLDLVVVKYSASINHYTAINLTKLDVLDSFPEIKIATAYSHPETKERIESFPADLGLLEQCNIVYETIEGWQTSTTGVREWGDLPEQARRYVEFIEKFIDVPVKWVGTGPRREDIIQRGS